MDAQDYNKHDEEDEYNELFKGIYYLITMLVVLVGDAGVGKTHLMNRYRINI
jgi:GTPase SAR1 family protein